MISTEEIKKLSELARIEIADEEAGKLAQEIDAILGYVGQISELATEGDGSEVDVAENHNVLREDMNPTEPGTHTGEIIAEFPDSEDNYLRVKKIL